MPCSAGIWSSKPDPTLACADLDGGLDHHVHAAFARGSVGASPDTRKTMRDIGFYAAEGSAGHRDRPGVGHRCLAGIGIGHEFPGIRIGEQRPRQPVVEIVA